MSSQEIARRGFLLVLSSPSGAGKTTIARGLLARNPGLVLSVSVTTRLPRPGETDGRDYHFIARERFDEMAAGGELLEHATVFGHSYGTPRRPIEEALAAGHEVVADLDWQGTQQLARTAADDLVSVFVLPPRRAALFERLSRRGQDSPEAIARRMAMSAEEMSHWLEYDYVLVNRVIEKSIAEVEAIIAAERLRRKRQTGLADFVRSLLSE
jgi:guanylate kinase